MVGGQYRVLDPSVEATLSEVLDDYGLSTTGPDPKFESLIREIVPLEWSDLEALQVCGPSRSQSGVETLRAIHHVIALKLASGERPVDISATLSVTQQTISRLSKEPQFQELVESYREQLVDKAVDTFELMSIVGTETLMAMHERLIDEDIRQNIPFESLRRTAETLVDRVGHSPVRRSESMSRVTHDLSTATIKRIRDLHTEDTAYKAETIEASLVEAHKEDSANSGAALSIPEAFGTVVNIEVSRNESGGPRVRDEGGQGAEEAEGAEA